MPRALAMRTCVRLRARRSPCKVISSAMSVAARRSILLRRAGLTPFIFCSRVFMALPSYLLQTGQMALKPLVGLGNELAVEPSFAAARFVTADQKNGTPL